MSDGKYSKLKLFWHPDKVQSFAEGRITAPIYVRVKPTNICNHGCFFCVYHTDFSSIHENMEARDSIPPSKMEEILEDFQEMGVKAVTYSGGGEPLIYPYIIPAMERTLERNIDLSIITNGQMLNGKAAEVLGNAKWVRVSIDYCDEQTFEKSRRRPGRMFRQVVDNVEGFSKMRQKNCSLGVNYVIHAENFSRVYESARFLRDIGVDNVKFSPMWKPGFEEYHAPFRQDVIDQLSRARADFSDESFLIVDTYGSYFETGGKSERKYTQCLFMQVVPVIGADSNVYFCHNKAYENTGLLGSIRDRRFKELWFSDESATKFREFNPQIWCKHECANDDKNLIYHEVLAARDKDVVNFP